MGYEDRGEVEMYVDWAEYDQKDRGRSKREMKGNRKREMGIWKGLSSFRRVLCC